MFVMPQNQSNYHQFHVLYSKQFQPSNLIGQLDI